MDTFAQLSRWRKSVEATSIIGEAGSTSREKVGRVSTEFFSTLGVNPFLGRAFSEEEMTYKTDLVAMISYEYWRARYNGDPGALGRSVRTDGISRVIVGVLPPGFHFLTFGAPVYMPLSSEARQRDVNSRHSNLDKIQIARLALQAINLEEARKPRWTGTTMQAPASHPRRSLFATQAFGRLLRRCMPIMWPLSGQF